ncbi:TonB-dependent receptor [Stenotrophomonas sp. MMGLT7]|uniref:TonB-dependent receptor plug domain-containing protein n=1 Tax=Stenotrophomonas sp. MMGLT7 TaxID=2901227 RepID=UPI001E55DA9E|nr:TonB-dependent receptor [Stenotrophomonas sp. MMGLT7]MCD7098566.1 TonB-dependent receptor [Stenotrophomonas sp. MMGLT7]
MTSRLSVSLLSAALAAGLPAAAVAADPPVSTLDALVVTGNRGQPRTVTDSPAPIDVISAEQLSRLAAGAPLRDVLSQLVPSYQSMSAGSSSWSSVARPAGLRGLSGGHVLVLVNGKRRHNSSLVDLNTGNVANGVNAVDLDLIPVSAIGHIEILRDGAAAQYGSDAIAGVINVILKSDAEGGQLSLQGGARYPWSYRDGSRTRNDGETVQLGLSHGFGLGDGGSSTWSMDYKSQQSASRGIRSTSTFYAAGDPREATVDKRVYAGGLPKLWQFGLAQNTVLPLGDGLDFYSNGTFAWRHAEVGQAGRLPNSSNNLVEVYPDGFTPWYAMDEYDYQLTGGLRGLWGEWDWDLSTSFGRNHVDHGSEHSLNASLGSASPTRFDTFTSISDLWVTNLDLTRAVQLAGRPLQISAGLEHRYEAFRTRAGDLAAYADGGYVYSGGSLAGQPAAVGAQGAIIVTPEDEADLHRNDLAAYADFSWDLSERWVLGAAGRFEHYDDSAGNVASGKLTSKFAFTPWLSLRGTVSNGFRAPSLSQMGFGQSSTAYANIDGAYTAIQSKTVSSSSALARALGGQDLEPEKSTNYSLGLVLTPADDLSLTVDAYRIALRDRVMLTGYLSGSGVDAILAANGFSTDQYVRYFANALDTRTTGVDVVGTWRQRSAGLGQFDWSVGYNWNKTEITGIAANPPALADLGLTLFNRQMQRYVTDGTPHNKLALALNWRYGRFDVNLRQTRYGSFVNPGTSAAYDERYGGKWITDLDLGYRLTPRVALAIGANNLFDRYPDALQATNTIGSAPYASNSPFGVYGGYYYARVTVDL